jgi:hypothetical protein
MGISISHIFLPPSGKMIAYDVHEEELAIMATHFSQLNMKIDYSLAKNKQNRTI